jgi:histidinol-phosphatase (PHP family)
MLPDYKRRYFSGNLEEYYRTHFNHLAMAAESGLFDTLAHPDLIKILEPEAWNIDQVLDEVRRSLDRIAKTDVAMELNTSGLNKPLAEMHPSATILAEMRIREIPVVVGADAHEPGRVAANFEDALELLKTVGYSHTNIVLNRQRHAVDIDTAINSLNPV